MFKHTFITLTVSVVVLGLLSVFQPQPQVVDQPTEQTSTEVKTTLKKQPLQVEESFNVKLLVDQAKEAAIIKEKEAAQQEEKVEAKESAPTKTQEVKKETKAAPTAQAKPAASKPVEKAKEEPKSEVKSEVKEEPKAEVAPEVEAKEEVAPAPAPAPAAPKVSRTPAATWELEVARLTNLEREKAGLSILTYNTSLEAGANIRANEIIDNFSHTRPDGSRFFTAFGNLQYRNIGENLGNGFRSPESIVNAWMNSEGHRKNILKPEYQEISVAITKDADGKYRWVQIFYRGR